MAFALDVHAIDSALTDHWYVPGRCRSYWFKLTDEVSDLKDAIEETFGTRAKDQRYHGLEKAYGQKLRFHKDRILQDCDDDDNLYAVLKILCKNGMINFRYTIAVVRIPIPSGRLKSQRKRSAGEPAAEGNDDSDDNDDVSDDSDDDSDDSDDDSDDSDVKVLGDVDTVQARIDAGRVDAIEVGDEDSSEGGEDEEEQPPQKRARRANGESEAEPRARRDGNGMGEEEQDQESESANEADEVRAGNGGDNVGGAEAGDAEEAAAARGRNVRAARWGMRASAGPRGSPSELRLWLQGIDDAYRRHANAVDAYTGAFERDGHEIGEEEEADEAEEAKADDEGDEGGNIEARADNEGDDGGDAEAGDAEEAAAEGGENAHSEGEEEEADEAEEVRADNEADEGGNAEAWGAEAGDEGGDTEAGNAGEAAATAEGEDAQPAPGEDVQAPAPEDPPAPSELQQWLRRIDAEGRHANAFEAYTAAFEREFRSLEDLALAADGAPDGLERIFRACGVRTLGDRARLRWAIANLPRPVRPAGVRWRRLIVSIFN